MKLSRTMSRGQAMLLTVLSIGGIILGATTIAGLLTVYQIRASTDAAHSAQAIFAADTGIGWAEFDYYCNIANPSTCVQAGDQPLPVFSVANASATIVCTDASSSITLCSDTSTAINAFSKGWSIDAVRAFELNLPTAQVTVP